MNYQDFVSSKMSQFQSAGLSVCSDRLNKILFPFQKSIVSWAIRQGRAAIFAECGLGKTLMQLEWGRWMGEGGNVLIFAPLTVADQTICESRYLGFGDLGGGVNYCQTSANLRPWPWINITNYERLDYFIDAELQAVILDESSILKAQDGKTRTRLINAYQRVPYRLCCTATPAPNDITEIANHAEFLGVKTRQEMLAAWFVHDSDGWRLKGHATREFYRWMASWAVYVRRPSDLGFSDEGYDLPALDVRQTTVACEVVPDGFLFPVEIADGLVGRSQVRRATLEARVQAAIGLVNSEPDEPWILWTGLNDESDALARALGNQAVQVEGNTSTFDKQVGIEAFLRGDARILITKPRVCGFGMNFQHCARMAFVGIGDSWEQYYQCLRRCWRFGQRREVVAYIVASDAEGPIVRNVMRKEEDAKTMGDQILEHIGDLERANVAGDVGEELPPGILTEASGNGWRLIHGDCVESLRERVESNSVHLSVFSPPFATLYTYSDNPRDMGNSRNHEEFFDHFGFLIPELLRVTIPGRLACVHVAQVATTLATHGIIGISDFRGRVINAFVNAGWVFHREVCIDKDPQAQAIRTHSKALLFVQKEKDRSWIGPALADYILVFRKPGDNPIPIRGGIDNETWIQWARPIWYGIKETDTLNVAEARSEKDERHICPLQLGTIERCVRLWSNPQEVVLSPFAGIGSEGFKSLMLDRKFVGVELKPEYWRVAKRNLQRAEQSMQQESLFA